MGADPRLARCRVATTTTTVTAAIRIETGYPNTELNMVYFFPALARMDGKPIGATDAPQPLDGKTYQRWSRHRTAAQTPGRSVAITSGRM